jgi:hypothetical protein
MKLLIILALAVVAYAATDRQLYNEWRSHVAKYSRQYHNDEHARQGFENFAREHRRVNEHNARFRAGLETYEAGLNQFSDMSPAERARSTGLNHIEGELIPSKRSLNASIRYKSPYGTIYSQVVCDKNIPASIDHSQHAGQIRDQGQCGSCYSFAGTKVVEMHLAKLYNLKYTLAPQQLVDCSTPFGNNGCNGGFVTNDFDYYMSTGTKFVQESQYPYKGAVQTKSAADCQALSATSTIKAKVSGYVVAKPNDDCAVKTLLAYGPAFGAIYVSPDSPLYSYKTGIITDASAGGPNHAITVVGYDTINGTQVYKILNSWGSSWGMGGFAYIKQGEIQISADVFAPNITLTA